MEIEGADIMKTKQIRDPLKKGYYIYYPKRKTDEVLITKKPENWHDYIYAFGEGPYKTKDDVIRRLNWMNISVDKRPKGWKDIQACSRGYRKVRGKCVRA